MDAHAHPTLAATADLSAVQAELTQIEALEDELLLRLEHLRLLLPPEQFRLVWALCDAEQRLGLAERLLAQRHFVGQLTRRLPGSAGAIRAAARDLLDEASPASDAN